jgi:VWFA-related protein
VVFSKGRHLHLSAKEGEPAVNRHLIFAVVLLTGTFAVAQDPQPNPKTPPAQQAPTINEDDVVRITTNLVQVDAVVTRNGRPVKNLKAEDFEIFEDGRKQTVTSFGFISNTSPAKTSDTASMNRPPVTDLPEPYEPRRTIALVIDDLGMSAESITKTKRQLRNFVNQQLQPNDLVAIIRTGGDVGALQQFTTDHRVLNNAIEQLKWNFCSRVGPSVFNPSQRLATVTGENPALAESSVPDAMWGTCGRESASGTLKVLSFILRSMGELPGRKSMILFSDSIPRQEQELPSTFVEYQLGRYSAAPTSRDLYFGLQRLAELAIRNSVVIYSVDTQGLQYTGPTAADSFNGPARSVTQEIKSLNTNRSSQVWQRREGSELLATETGGFLVRGANDFKLPQILEDQEGYYLIGYRPGDGTFDRKFHHIKVQARGSGLKTRTRKGFYGVSEEDVKKARLNYSEPALIGLISPFAAHDINVDLAALFAHDQNSGSMLRCFLSVPGQDLTFTPQPNGFFKGTIEVRGMIFGDNGAVVDTISNTATLNLQPESYKQAIRDGVALQFNMPIKRAGGYQFRVVVKDVPSARLGSAGQFVAVPDLTNHILAMSGIVIFPVTVKLAMTSSGQTIVDSPAVRHFKRGSDLMFAAAVYNATLDALTHQPQITISTRLFHEGKVVKASEALKLDLRNQTDFTVVVARGLVHLSDDLETGKYFLQLIVVDELAKRKMNATTQWIDLEVQP